tara:strand:- start:192 stop:866 length:675 start_codon:yes stop_codon:yes gene_type:complete
MRVIFEKNLVFVSKPRCGSTSVRKTLTKFIKQNYPNSDSNDLIIDFPETVFHPHITGPYLRELLKAKYKEKANNLEYFTVIRNPLDMLKSYYFKFQPDTNSNYNYSPKYNSKKISFLDWLLTGSVGMEPKWEENAPSWISSIKNFTPLSLEAHGYDKNNNNILDHTFLLEEPKTLKYFLSNKLGEEIFLPHINQSKKKITEKLPDHILDLIKVQFPIESELYNL